MKNRTVGMLIIAIAVLIGFITFSFNRALVDIVGTSCTHGTSCPMWGTIDYQTNMSIGLMGFVVAIGAYLVFFGEQERIITRIKRIKPFVAQVEPKNFTTESYKKVMGNLSKDEKSVLERIMESQGTMFQSDLVEKTKFGKVRITRILDKMEGLGILERKRRGMTNVVMLK